MFVFFAICERYGSHGECTICLYVRSFNSWTCVEFKSKWWELLYLILSSCACVSPHKWLEGWNFQLPLQFQKNLKQCIILTDLNQWRHVCPKQVHLPVIFITAFTAKISSFCSSVLVWPSWPVTLLETKSYSCCVGAFLKLWCSLCVNKYKHLSDQAATSSSPTSSSPPPPSSEKLSVKKFLEMLKGPEHVHESNRKMQRMLEEVLTKNMHLQNNLDQLSLEVVRLSKGPDNSACSWGYCSRT